MGPGYGRKWAGLHAFITRWLTYACACTLAVIGLGVLPSPASAQSGGEVLAWGRNGYGQLGGGFKTGPGGGEESPVSTVGVPNDVTALASGEGEALQGFALALLSTGEVLSWGGHGEGVLGDGNQEREEEKAATGECDIEAVEEGSGEEEGAGEEGTAESEQPSEYTERIHVIGPHWGETLKNVTAIAAATWHDLALADEKVFAWGANAQGEHGNKKGGARCETHEPLDLAQEVKNLSGIKAIAAGGGADFAVQKATSEHPERVMAWGRDVEGRLDVQSAKEEESTKKKEKEESEAWKQEHEARMADQHCLNAITDEQEAEKAEQEASKDESEASEDESKEKQEEAAAKRGEAAAKREAARKTYEKWKLTAAGCAESKAHVENEARVSCAQAATDEAEGNQQAAQHIYESWSLSRERCEKDREENKYPALPPIGEPAPWLCNTGESGLVRCSKEPRPVLGTEPEKGVTIEAVVAGASDAFALYSNGTIRAWGSNVQSQLGVTGTKENKVTPWAEPVSGIHPGEALAISAAPGEPSHALVLLASGKVVGWGINTSDDLGPKSEKCKNEKACIKFPTVVPGLPKREGERIVAVSAGEGTSFALNSEGEVLAWGRNVSESGVNYGKLGLGTTLEELGESETPLIPTPTVVKALVGEPPKVEPVRVNAIAAGETSTYAILRNGAEGGKTPPRMLTLTAPPTVVGNEEEFKTVKLTWSPALPYAKSTRGIHVCLHPAGAQVCTSTKLGTKELEKREYTFEITGSKEKEPIKEGETYAVTINNGQKTRASEITIPYEKTIPKP